MNMACLAPDVKKKTGFLAFRGPGKTGKGQQEIEEIAINKNWCTKEPAANSGNDNRTQMVLILVYQALQWLYEYTTQHIIIIKISFKHHPNSIAIPIFKMRKLSLKNFK